MRLVTAPTPAPSPAPTPDTIRDEPGRRAGPNFGPWRDRTDHRVLYLVQIKSLDKRLRTLDAAMTHAKDDPSLLHAVHGYVRWSESSEHAGWNGAESPMLCSTDASNATTPTLSSPSFSSSPSLASPLCSGCCTPRDLPFPSAAMYKKMAEGQSDMSFDAKGLNSPCEPPALDVQIMSSEAELGEVKMEGEEDGGWGGEASDTQEGMSDQDIIAMLADCAARPEPSPHHKFAEVLSQRITAVADEMRHSEYAESAAHVQALACDRHPALEDGDDALMAALANCCGGQSPFEARDDEKRVRQQDALEPASLNACVPCTLSEDVETRFEDEVMALQTFSGCHGLTLEDLP